MLECTDRHVSADLIEEYCFGRLPPVELVWFETHLLICVDCRNRVTDMDELILCLKLALGRQRASRLAPMTPEENPLVAC